MGKTTVPRGDSALREIPSVERILSSQAFSELASAFGRPRVKDSLVRHLSGIRSSGGRFHEPEAVAVVRRDLQASGESSLRRVINGSGVIIHTNLGRSPIDPALWREAEELVAGYSNLEFDLDEGERGARDEHLLNLCASLFGCEAALLANNNASGTLLLLAAIAAGKEVLVSRGELVEIGGAFRVPDVIQQGGARLREVGTTNRTRARDYADAAGPETAAILRVHRSNFEIVGFTETPAVEDLVEVARDKKIPLLYDEGSGTVVDLSKYGFRGSPTVREELAKGIDAITCSTDKLIGSTQGGLILGTREIVSRCRRHPLMRAVRAGKESYAIIAATLRAFLTERHEEQISIYRMLSASIESLRSRANEMIAGTTCRIVESRCALGGGTTPDETIPSVAIEVPGNAAELHAQFLKLPIPIVGRIQNDRFTIEVRTLLDQDRGVVAAALRG